MTNPIKWTELNPTERSRTYHFPGGEVVTVNEVARLEVRESGTHRYETKDGRKGFVSKGWLWLEIDVEAWSC
jgi:hypothetical protein